MLCLGLSSQRKKEMPRTRSPHRTNFLMVAKLKFFVPREVSPSRFRRERGPKFSRDKLAYLEAKSDVSKNPHCSSWGVSGYPGGVGGGVSPFHLKSKTLIPIPSNLKLTSEKPNQSAKQDGTHTERERERMVKQIGVKDRPQQSKK